MFKYHDDRSGTLGKKVGKTNGYRFRLELQYVQLGAEAQAAVGRDQAPGHPAGLGVADDGDDAGDLLHVGGPAAPPLGDGLDLVRVPLADGGQRDEGAPDGLGGEDVLAALAEHVGQHGARVDGVDGGVLGELAGPGPGHGLEGALGAAVEGEVRQAALLARAGHVDDAAGAVLGQERLGRADEEDGAQDVGAVRLVEVLGGDALDRARDHLGGAVDEDVDLGLARRLVDGELGLDRLDDAGCALGGADVGAVARGEDVVLRDQLLGERGRGRVRCLGEVDDQDVGSLLCQVLGDTSTDACVSVSVSLCRTMRWASRLVWLGGYCVLDSRAAPVTMASLPSWILDVAILSDVFRK